MNYEDCVKEYQCTGCTNGSFPECFNDSGEGCRSHSAGTYMMGVGKLFLGMPKGFNRSGVAETESIEIFKSFPKHWYDMFNVPVWKYLDEHENTIVRGISPRINSPFIHVISGNHIDKIDCLEITNEDLEDMD